jgi:hypothetical protein
VFQEADQTVPQCCFCSFLHLDAPQRAKVISHSGGQLSSRLDSDHGAKVLVMRRVLQVMRWKLDSEGCRIERATAFTQSATRLAGRVRRAAARVDGVRAKVMFTAGLCGRADEEVGDGNC